MKYSDFYGSPMGAPPASQQGAVMQQLQSLMQRVAALEKQVAILTQDAGRKTAFVKDALSSFRGINDTIQALATAVTASPSDQAPRQPSSFINRPPPAGYLPTPYPVGSGFPKQPQDATYPSDLASDDDNNSNGDTDDDDF